MDLNVSALLREIGRMRLQLYKICDHDWGEEVDEGCFRYRSCAKCGIVVHRRREASRWYLRGISAFATSIATEEVSIS